MALKWGYGRHGQSSKTCGGEVAVGGGVFGGAVSYHVGDDVMSEWVQVLESLPVEARMVFLGVVLGAFLSNLQRIGQWVLVLLKKVPPQQRLVCQGDFRKFEKKNEERHERLQVEVHEIKLSISKLQGQLAVLKR